MKTNRWFLAIFCTWLLCSAVRGQQPNTPPIFSPPPPIPGNGENGAAPGPTAGPGGGLSDWILYNNGAAAVPRDCCNNPLDRLTPLYTELYLRAGPSVPVGGKTLSHELETGWSIVGGGRVLIFDAPMTSAWTVDAHIINTNESGGRQNTRFPVTVFSNGARLVFGSGGVPGVTIRASNRTMAGLGGGREWYLLGTADSHDCKWRVGVDVGGRCGSQRIDLDETRHLTGIIAGFYGAIHTDLEIPIHQAVFVAGLRIEFAQTYSDILQQNSNVADLNFLATFGWRF